LANFVEHIRQANSNLEFLEAVNKTQNSKYDWQVTAAYYSAVHLINSHLSIFDLHFRTHDQTKDALNPFKQVSVTKVPEEIYLAYLKMEGLSRRARYLCHDNPRELVKNNLLTHSEHLKKTLTNLDLIVDFISTKYKISFLVYYFDLEELKGKKLKFFKHLSEKREVVGK
jgi:uncharacterized protein (UPF0332 family)